MRKIIILLIVVIGILSQNKTANAGYIAGGNISYRALDSVTYLITARIFVFCDTIPYTPNDTLIVSWQGNSYKSVMTLTGITDITGTFYKCSTASKCSGGGNPYGINEFLFSDTVNLSGTACKVTFGWQGGQRSPSVTTGSANTPVYLFSETNKCVGINSSLHPTLPPHFIIPVGRDAMLNCGFIDTIDGDSMGFKLVNPLSAPSTLISYSGSFSASKPISFLGSPNIGLPYPAGFYFDSTNADNWFRPTKQNEVTQFCIETYEFRKVNGQMVEIGRTRLEKVVIVIPYPNNFAPKIIAAAKSVCQGDTVCFNITTDDRDTGDTTHLIWNKGIKGATFIIDSTGKNSKGTFCWTPTQEDVRNWPHNFTVRVRDDGCSPNGITTRVFGIMVYPKADSNYFEVEKKEFSCNRLRVKMKKVANSVVKRQFSIANASVLVSTQDSLDVFFTSNGWKYYTITTSFYGVCSYTQTDSVWVPPYKFEVATTRDTAVCPKDTFIISAIPKNGISPYTQLWFPQNTHAPQITDALTQPKQYRVLTRDSLWCTVSDTINVSVYNLQKVNFILKDSVCGNDSPFVLKAVPPNGNWYSSDTVLVQPDIFHPLNAVAGKHTLTYSANDSNGCFITGNAAIQVLPFSVPDFATVQIIGRPVFTADVSFWSTPMADTWIWQLERNGNPLGNPITYNGPSPATLNFNDTGVFSISLTVLLGQCSATVSKKDYITIGPLSGIEEKANPLLKIYPIPVNAGTPIIIEGELIHDITLFDAFGRPIPVEADKTTDRKLLINTSGLSAGVYWLAIFDEKQVGYICKVVINP